MPGAGAVQVTIVEPCCLQVEGGSLPVATELSFVSLSALISALGAAFFGFALADIVGMVFARPATSSRSARPRCPVPRPPGPGRQAAPASAACGTTADPAGGLAAAARGGLARLTRARDAELAAVGGEGATRLARAGLAIVRLVVAGLAVACGRPRLAGPGRRGRGRRPGNRVGETASARRAGHVAPGEPVRRCPGMAAGHRACGPPVRVPKTRDDSVPGTRMPRAMRAASTNSRQLR